MISRPRKISRISAAVTLLAVLLFNVSLTLANDITLRQSVTLPAGAVLLKDIATLNGEQAQQLGQTVVGQIDKAGLTISMQDVRSKLDAAGVNWARLSLRGFMSCQVSLKTIEAETSASLEAPATAVAMANPMHAVASDSVMTLRDLILSELARHTGQSRDDLRVTFNPRDTQILAQSVLADRWEVEVASAGRLGRVLLTIRRWQNDRVTQTHRVGVDVARRALAVVAVRDIRRSEVIAAGDVEIQEVFLTDPHRTPATDLQAVIGKAAREPFTKGQMIYASEASKPELIKRGDRLVVRCVVGGLVVKISARAVEGGAMDDIITVANLDSNERFKARVAGTREAMLVDAPETDKEIRHD
jgi:flagella basal body P-ring formation protein FlgA